MLPKKERYLILGRPVKCQVDHLLSLHVLLAASWLPPLQPSFVLWGSAATLYSSTGVPAKR
jgi:hypothetical protein